MDIGSLVAALAPISSECVVLKASRKKAPLNRYLLNAQTRASRYIGASRNGHYWQALLEIRKRKIYLGIFPTERMAAINYDKWVILIRGVKVSGSHSLTFRRRPIFLTRRQS